MKNLKSAGMGAIVPVIPIAVVNRVKPVAVVFFFFFFLIEKEIF